MKLILFLLTISASLHANNTILSQGAVSITFDDVDGFAYKMPSDVRSGFFNSSKRIDGTLTSLLNMKQMIEYGKLNHLFNTIDVENNVNFKLLELYPEINDNFNVTKENEIKLIKNYLKLEESFKLVKEKISDRYKLNDFQDLAFEIYNSETEKYKTKEKRDVRFISYLYEKHNKVEIINKAKIDFTSIQINKMSFSELYKKYKDNDPTIETSEIVDFEIIENQKRFSNKIFSIKEIGTAQKLVDFNNRIIIINITKIKHSKKTSFEDVKLKLLTGLKKKKVETIFGTLLNKLTKEKIILNEENFSKLVERYKD